MTVAGRFETSLRRLGRNPEVAFIPFVFDAVVLGLIVLLIVTVGADPSIAPSEVARPNFVADLPEALPTVKYVGDPVGVLYDRAPAHLAAVAVALMISVPVRAYGTAGFVGLLYHRVHKGLGARSRSFFTYARRFYLPMLAFEAAFTLLFLPGLYILLVSPQWAVAYAAGALLAFALLLFAPYAVVADGATVGRSVKRSVRAFVRNPATCLPVFAVALVATGGFALVAQALIASHGLWGYLAAGLLFSPMGAVLSLLFLTTYAELRVSPYVSEDAVGEAA